MKYSSETNHILKTMYKTGGISKNQLPSSELKRLFKDNYIANSTDFHDNNVYLTDKGRAYVEEVKSEQRRIVHDWVNTGIAFGALIVAIISIIVSLMR